MQTTNWKDNSSSSLDMIINRILNFKEEEIDIVGDQNFKIEKVFSQNQKLYLVSKEIVYNKMNITYDCINSGIQPVEERTKTIKMFLLIYAINGEVYYITDRKTGAMRIIRKLNGYKKQKEITQLEFGLKDDFFKWIIFKVYHNENIIDSSPDKNLGINSIRKLKGDTNDSLTKITADGETVMNLITTLSFILESKNIQQLKIEIEYGEHKNISLVLCLKSYLRVEVKEYFGELMEKDEEVQIVELLLISYLEIIPKMKQIYQNEIDNNKWTTDKYKEFLRALASDVTKRIEYRIENDSL